MKKHYLLAIALFAVVAACKKDKQDNYYITATVDGKSMSFSSYADASKSNSTGSYQLSFTGLSEAVNKPALVIWMDSYNPYAVGLYTDTTWPTILNVQIQENDTTIYSGGFSTARLTTDPNFNHTIVNITHLENNAIRGTFSGTLYKSGDLTAEKRVVTNGNFYLKVSER